MDHTWNILKLRMFKDDTSTNVKAKTVVLTTMFSDDDHMHVLAWCSCINSFDHQLCS